MDSSSGFIEQTDDEIRERVVELDGLINELCDLVKFSAAARARMVSARRKMPAASLPAELAYFRQQLSIARRR